MKKALIVMTVVLLAVCLTGIPIYAKAQQASFYNDGFGIDKTIPGSGGKVIINLPKGKVGMVVQGMVKGLDPDTDYYVLLWADYDTDWYTPGTGPLGKVGSWFRFTSFTTNAVGRGSFHINIDADDLAMGTYPISVWIDEVESEPSTPGYPYVTVLVSYEIEVEIQ